MKGYLIVDIGTGNTRVGFATPQGEVLGVATCDTEYRANKLYPDSLQFDPKWMWNKIRSLTKEVLEDVGKAEGVEVLAVTSTSQREGIVLMDEGGIPYLGLPNIDMRGREWEGEIPDHKRINALTGRWVNTIFGALKLRGLKERERDLYEKMAKFLSIGDWVCYMFSGVMAYEPSQASETLLFDIEKGAWSDELCGYFGIDSKVLPEVRLSGDVLGKVRTALVDELGISADAVVVVGGADTELGILGSQAEVDDIVAVSGTTTPLVKVLDSYVVDDKQRYWVHRHVENDAFVIESNPGITGLTYQRFKDRFFAEETYAEIEDMIEGLQDMKCVASFTSWTFDRQMPLLKSGIEMMTPLHEDYSRVDMAHSIIFDIASAIKYNYDALMDISPSEKDYILACGGGVTGKLLPQLIADLTGKKVVIKKGFRQASILGGVNLCNKATGGSLMVFDVERTVEPSGKDYSDGYAWWLEHRNRINGIV